jgi:hypothetical protein
MSSLRCANAVQLLEAVQPIWTGCTASGNCTGFLSYLAVFEQNVVQCCADEHFFVVIRTGVSAKAIVFRNKNFQAMVINRREVR